MVCPICFSPLITETSNTGESYQYCSVDECPYSQYLDEVPNEDLEF